MKPCPKPSIVRKVLGKQPDEKQTEAWPAIAESVQKFACADGSLQIPDGPVCEGRFLQILAAISGAKVALEFGALGGYSATWIARGLAPGGRLITAEIDPVSAEIARETFRQANLQDTVQLIEGDAMTNLRQLTSLGPFDFVFIDNIATVYAPYFTPRLLQVLVWPQVAASYPCYPSGPSVPPTCHQQCR